MWHHDAGLINVIIFQGLTVSEAKIVFRYTYTTACALVIFIFPKFLVAIAAIIKSQSPLDANVASYKNAYSSRK